MGDQNQIEVRITGAQSNQGALNDLISEYIPFIARVVRNHVGHFVIEGRDDELSVGMTAFEEAVKTYVPDKGHFLPYAERIIRWRLIDYFRKNAKWAENISLEQIKEVNETAPLIGALSQEKYHRSQELDQMTAEILEFREALSQWDIDFKELARHSPKQDKIRRLLIDTAREICRDPVLLQKLKKTEKVPVNEILSRGWIDRKRMERGRIYIIACVIVLSGDYEMIHEYLEWR